MADIVARHETRSNQFWEIGEQAAVFQFSSDRCRFGKRAVTQVVRSLRIRQDARRCRHGLQQASALACLEARVQLVDDVDAALATNQAVFAVTGLQGLERILDLHFS
jgi:hypothetical protein